MDDNTVLRLIEQSRQLRPVDSRRPGAVGIRIVAQGNIVAVHFHRGHTMTRAL